MDELPVFSRKGEGDVETEDLGVEANRGVDVRNGQGRDDVFHVVICSFLLRVFMLVAERTPTKQPGWKGTERGCDGAQGPAGGEAAASKAKTRDRLGRP